MAAVMFLHHLSFVKSPCLFLPFTSRELEKNASNMTVIEYFAD